MNNEIDSEILKGQVETNPERRLENFQRWVQKKGITGKCSECGAQSFAILGRDGGNTTLPLDNVFDHYVTYAFECMNCGYIKQFSARRVERGLKE